MWAKSVLFLFLIFLGAIIFLVNSGFDEGIFSFINQVPGKDKTGHFLIMGTFCFLLNSALENRLVPKIPFRFFLGTLIALIFVTTEECSQIFLSSRTFDLMDMLSNYLGILVADLTGRFIRY